MFHLETSLCKVTSTSLSTFGQTIFRAVVCFINDIYVGHFSLYIDLETHGSQTLAYFCGLPAETDKGSCHAELLLEQMVVFLLQRILHMEREHASREKNVL